MKLIKTRNILTAAMLFLITGTAVAQQEPQFTQYMYNPTSINPAYAGSRDALSIFGQYRTQWTGLEGAPSTFNLSVHSPITDSKLGLGLTVISDNLGAMSDNTVAADVSYTIDLSRDYKLAFGIKVSANLLNVDYSKLLINDPTEVGANVDNKFTPNIGAGAFLYSDKTYVGVSAPMFLEADRYDDNERHTLKQNMHIYATAGHVFDLSREVKFKPAFLTKIVSGAPLQLDLSANFMLYDKLTLGAAYRWDAAFSGLVGYQLSDQFFIGYSYDADTERLVNYNSGSHEFLVRFELFKRHNRFVSPRFF